MSVSAPTPPPGSAPPEPRPSRAVETIFLLLGVVLVAGLAITYWSGLRVFRLNAAIGRHHVRLLDWRSVLSDVQDAETGQRGYLLTGQKEYLAPYQRAVSRLHADELRLPAGSAHAARLRELIGRKLAELEKTVAFQQRGAHDQALAVVRSNEGRELMERIRSEIETAVQEEEAVVTSARASADHATIQRNFLFGAVGLVTLLFLPWAYRRMQAEMAARLAAQREGQRQRELLAVTLTSIGDAVIVTDTEARVTYMNRVAEELTGWTTEEARHRECAEIFRIINEESRGPAVNPVDRVLREGMIVGLANHTLLVRRDGKEIPIDDSGAPIRDDGGACLGAVLVFRDFTEHKENERALKAANAEAAAASLAKDRFLAALSHELRTPLTPVLALLSDWEAGAAPEALVGDVRMLRRNVEFEARLIDDLLDLTRISKGKILFHREIVDLHEIARAAAAIMDEAIRRKGLELEVRIPPEPRLVEGDAIRLQQVILNLLQNAAKFTARGRVSLMADLDGEGRARVTVTDTGIGMEKESLERIFGFFEQGSDRITRRFGGLGLGLALAQSIVQAHGGTLAAQSDGEGRGSTFVVTLPLAPVSTATAASATPAGALPAPPKLSELPPLRILIVEDHPDTLNILQRLLRRAGHSVQGVTTVEAAKALLSSGDVDFLISDLGLPDGSGHELVRSVRPHFQRPAIALSGYGLDEDILRARDAGFKAHLTKPVNFDALSQLIVRLALSPDEPWHGPADSRTGSEGEAPLGR